MNSIKAFQIFLFILFFVFSNVYPQAYHSLFTLPQGHIISGLSGYGYTISTYSTISTFNSSNPANIYDFDSLNVGLSYQYETKILDAHPYDIGYSRAYPYLPQSFGIVFQIGQFKFGIGTNQIYNSEEQYREVHATFVWPDENGFISFIINPKYSEIIFKNSVSFAFEFEKLKNAISGSLILGAQYNYNWLKYKREFNNPNITDSNGEISASNFSIGLRYDYIKHDRRITSIGIYYEGLLEYDEEKFENDFLVRFIGYIPEKLHLGFLLNLNSSVFVAGNISVLFWESVNRKYSNKLNNSELSGTVGYQFNTKFSLSFGISSNYYRYDENNSPIDYNKLHANYFFCGFTYAINSFFSELVVADSHLLSDDWRKHTIVKLGLGYGF